MPKYIVRGRTQEGSMERLSFGEFHKPVTAVRLADQAFKAGNPCVDVLVQDDDGFSERIYLRRADSALLNVPKSQLMLVEEVA